MADMLIIESLREAMTKTLPGRKSQLQMAPGYSKSYTLIKPGHQVACVLVLLFVQNGEWHVTYIQRPVTNAEDRHAGQISFPGGRLEDDDPSLEYCVLRETHEEIGVIPGAVQLIGKLTELYVWVSNYYVHPFVGYMEGVPIFTPQVSEVSKVITPSLEYMTNERILKRGKVENSRFIIQDVPYFDLYGEKLWGATAMITHEFLEIVHSLPLKIA